MSGELVLGCDVLVDIRKGGAAGRYGSSAGARLYMSDYEHGI
jgi:hypothetical protein